MLQTRRSPAAVCVASISNFCLEEDPCHAKPVIGDGSLEVWRVYKMVKECCMVAIIMDPFAYLAQIKSV